VRDTYGPATVRLVWKNLPLPFHPHARPAAEAAMGVFALAGVDAFWRFHHAAFAGDGRLEEARFEGWAQEAGVTDMASWKSGLSAHTWARAVDLDLADGDALGVDGTPTFFVNGIQLVGQQSFEELKAVVDAQVKAAQAKLAAGTPKERLYAELSRENRAAAPKDEKQDPEDDTKTVFKVPLGGSPARGPAGAPVTIVEFGDYQCPFCVRAEGTITALRRKYGNDLRVVFKDSPLDFHARAEPAAEAAREVRAEKGDAAFWAMHDALFSQPPQPQAQQLEDDALFKLAVAQGASADRVKAAIGRHKYEKEIAKDLDLADDLQANGTPQFFINGRRLVGAQPQERFEAMIDEEIAHARTIVGGGIRPEAVYAEIIGHGKEPDPPEQRAVPTLPKGDPARGGAENALVTIHEWADFECPFCAHVDPTLGRVMDEYRGKVRIVWHDFPLQMHAHAAGAAQAAREALKQKGEAGFWALHDTLFKNQHDLAPSDLDGYASSLKLDLAAWRAALESGGHRAELTADEKAGEELKINGTPAFLVVPRGQARGYFIDGAQPMVKFRKLVERALAEAK
jgi:protein-disulfide isomerase